MQKYKSLHPYKNNVNMMYMIVTDQPGRWLAVTVFSPILAYKSWIYKDKFIAAFSAALFAWDLYWLLYHEPKQNHIRNNGFSDTL